MLRTLYSWSPLLLKVCVLWFTLLYNHGCDNPLWCSLTDLVCQTLIASNKYEPHGKLQGPVRARQYIDFLNDCSRVFVLPSYIGQVWDWLVAYSLGVASSFKMAFSDEFYTNLMAWCGDSMELIWEPVPPFEVATLYVTSLSRVFLKLSFKIAFL